MGLSDQDLYAFIDGAQAAAPQPQPQPQPQQAGRRKSVLSDEDLYAFIDGVQGGQQPQAQQAEQPQAGAGKSAFLDTIKAGVTGAAQGSASVAAGLLDVATAPEEKSKAMYYGMGAWAERAANAGLDMPAINQMLGMPEYDGGGASQQHHEYQDKANAAAAEAKAASERNAENHALHGTLAGMRDDFRQRKEIAQQIQQENQTLRQQQKAFEDAQGFLGATRALVTSPALVANMLGQSAAPMALGGAGAAGAAGTAGRLTRALGGSAARAGKVAESVASAVGVLGEAGTEALTAQEEARASVMSATHEELIKHSPRFRELLAQGMNPDGAQAQLAEEQAALLAGPTALATAGGAKLAHALHGDDAAKMFARQKVSPWQAARTPVGEASEEVFQTVAQNIAQNPVELRADETHKVDIGKEAATGALIGFGMAAPGSAAAYAMQRHNEKRGRNPDGTPKKDDDDAPQSGGDTPAAVDTSVDTPSSGDAAPEAKPQKKGGGGFDYNAYVAKMRRRESGGKANALNPKSGALGADQFLASTWRGLVKQAQPAWAEGKSDAEILAMRADPAKSAEMRRLFDKGNAEALRAAGLPVNEVTMYAAHHFGAGGAVKFLKASDDTPTSALFSAKALEQNPHLRGKTKAQVLADFRKSGFSDGGSASGSVDFTAQSAAPDAAPDAAQGAAAQDMDATQEAVQDEAPAAPQQREEAPKETAQQQFERELKEAAQSDAQAKAAQGEEAPAGSTKTLKDDAAPDTPAQRQVAISGAAVPAGGARFDADALAQPQAGIGGTTPQAQQQQTQQQAQQPQQGAQQAQRTPQEQWSGMTQAERQTALQTALAGLGWKQGRIDRIAAEAKLNKVEPFVQRKLHETGGLDGEFKPTRAQDAYAPTQPVQQTSQQEVTGEREGNSGDAGNAAALAARAGAERGRTDARARLEENRQERMQPTGAARNAVDSGTGVRRHDEDAGRRAAAPVSGDVGGGAVAAQRTREAGNGQLAQAAEKQGRAAGNPLAAAGNAQGEAGAALADARGDADIADAVRAARSKSERVLNRWKAASVNRLAAKLLPRFGVQPQATAAANKAALLATLDNDVSALPQALGYVTTDEVRRVAEAQKARRAQKGKSDARAGTQAADEAGMGAVQEAGARGVSASSARPSAEGMGVAGAAAVGRSDGETVHRGAVAADSVRGGSAKHEAGTGAAISQSPKTDRNHAASGDRKGDSLTHAELQQRAGTLAADEVLTGDGRKIRLQNRDRAGSGSQQQVNKIAASPDYLAVAGSNDMMSGAPVVFGNGDALPEGAVIGRTKKIEDGRRDKYQVRYAVVEAGDIITSHNADGTGNKSYATGEAGKLRAVAGNGRAAGLIEGWRRGTMDDYRAELLEEAEAEFGLDADAVAAMKQPVLVRVMREADIAADMGDRTNTTITAELTPQERAANDAKRIDLTNVEIDERGQPTRRALDAFIQATPEAERAGMLDARTGEPTKQAAERFMAAIFKQAYQSDELVRLYAQATDPEARNVLHALAQSAPVIAQLSGKGQYDLRDAYASMAQDVVNAARRGEKLQTWITQGDFERSDEASILLDAIADDIRAPKRMGETLTVLAQAAKRQADIEANSAVQGGFADFGSATLPREDVFRLLAERTQEIREARGRGEIAEAVGALFSRSEAQEGAPSAEAQAAAQREFEQTERAYGGKAAYDAAKKAGKTKLTFRQWVQVRTPRFKAWFGNWEAKRARDAVMDMDAVPVKVPALWHDLPAKTWREEVRKAFEGAKKQGAVTMRDGREVRLTAVGFKETKQHSGIDRKALNLLANIREVLAQAHPITSVQHERAHVTDSVRAWHYYTAKVQMEGKPWLVRLVVREDVNGNIYYDNDLTSIEALENSIGGRGNHAARTKSGAPSTSADEHTLAQLLGDGKQGDVSAVVDEETGEPLVVYHGSSADFNVFDRTKTRANMDIQGNFFSPWEDDARGYGGNVRAFFLNMKKPAGEQQGYAALRQYAGQNEAGIKARERLQAQGFDGVNNGGEEYIVFDPQNIKSATDNVGTFDANSTDIRWSRGDTPATNTTTPASEAGDTSNTASNTRRPAVLTEAQQQNIAKVQEMAAGVARAWKNAPPVVVVHDINDLEVPRAVRDMDEALRRQGAASVPEAVYHEGKVYVFAGQVNTPDAVTRVVAHEVLAHHGLRGAFGDALKTVLADIDFVRRKQMVDLARRYGLFDAAKLPEGVTPATASNGDILRAMSAQQRRMAAEEVLAHMAETQPQLGFVRRAVAAIRTWLRQNVPGFGKVPVSDDEIIRSFILPAREWVQSGSAGGAAQSDEPRFARKQPPKVASSNGKVASNLQPSRRVPAHLAKTARAYGGEKAYETDKAAGRTKLTFQQWLTARTHAFKAWFGNWEAARAMRAVRAMDAVPVSVPQHWAQLPAKDWRAAVKAEYDKAAEQGAVKMRDGHKVLLARIGFNTTRQDRGADRDALNLLAGIRDVLAAAVHTGSRVHEAENAQDATRAWHYYAAKVNMGGREVLAKLVVREVNNGAFYFDDQLSEIENASDKQGGAPVAAGGMSRGRSGVALLSSKAGAHAAADADTVAATGQERKSGFRNTDKDTGEPTAAVVQQFMDTHQTQETEATQGFIHGDKERPYSPPRAALTQKHERLISNAAARVEQRHAAELLGQPRGKEKLRIRQLAAGLRAVAESEGWVFSAANTFSRSGSVYFGLRKNGVDVRVRVSDHANTNKGRHHETVGINLVDEAGANPDGHAYDTWESALYKLQNMSANANGETTVAGAPLVMFKRTDRGSVADRAQAIINERVKSGRYFDRAMRALTRALGIEKLTRAIGGAAAKALHKFTPEAVKAGLVADYGLPQEAIDARVLMQGAKLKQLRQAGSFVEKLATLTNEEAQLAYDWMTNESHERVMEALATLPDEKIAVLFQVRDMIDALGQEAVELGLLSNEAYQRNKGAYLHRSYAKHVLGDVTGNGKRRGKGGGSTAILGTNLHRRGIDETARMEQVRVGGETWWDVSRRSGRADENFVGRRLRRLERRADAGEGTEALPGMEGKRAGRVREVVYVPAGDDVPAQYKGWHDAGVWEVRDVAGDKLQIWRDYTAQERTDMGEIKDVRYAIMSTLQGMIGDVETARYLRWLSREYGKAPGEEVTGEIVDASEGYLRPFLPNEWVKVPETNADGTKAKRYGALAGKYVPGPVFNDIRHMLRNGRWLDGLAGDAFHTIMQAWKTSKTSLSPTVHVNNIMSNFVMADWADVSVGHLTKAMRIIMGAHDLQGAGVLGNAGNLAARATGMADREAAREIVQRYKDSGGELGSWTVTETMRSQMEPWLEKLEAQAAHDHADMGAQIGVMAALQRMAHGDFKGGAKAAAGAAMRAVGREGKTMIDLYGNEDAVFRLAVWLKAKEDGASDIEAGRMARRALLDYNINAPWIQMAKGTVYPFISFSYRGFPLLARTLTEKPHKMMKFVLFATMLNQLGLMLAGADDDDEVRRLLPEEKAGRVWGMVPKLIRMPWNDKNDSPVYLDIRRWIPMGDVFDVGQHHAALPLPPALMPGGPLAVMWELLSNKSQFTGKEITLETDTPREQAGKVAEHLYKSFMPNIPLPHVPGTPDWMDTWSTTNIRRALRGETDVFGREQSVGMAAAGSVGVKLGAYPPDVLRRNVAFDLRRQEQEIGKNISAVKRQLALGRITPEEAQKKVAAQNAKKMKLREEYARKLGAGEGKGAGLGAFLERLWE